MKTQIIVLLVSLMTLSVQAANEGPQATSSIPPQIIAQVYQGSGFGPMPRSVVIDILDNGTVQSTEAYGFDNSEKVTQIATLSAPMLKKLVEYVDATTPGELVFESPNAPQCTDAPSTSYYVISKKGEKIEVAGEQGCQAQIKHPQSKYDYRIKRILESFASIYSSL